MLGLDPAYSLISQKQFHRNVWFGVSAAFFIAIVTSGARACHVIFYLSPPALPAWHC